MMSLTARNTPNWIKVLAFSIVAVAMTFAFNGRFRVLDDSRKRTHLIDSWTGRTWVLEMHRPSEPRSKVEPEEPPVEKKSGFLQPWEMFDKPSDRKKPSLQPPLVRVWVRVKEKPADLRE